MPGVSDTAAQALLAVPMVTENQVMGVLAVIDKPGGFGADDESFLMQFAAQAAVAVQNSQLFEHTKSLDRLKSEFVAVVTHEIRTPLTSVLSAIELLSDDRYFANNEQQKKLLSIGEANAERLLTLISDILDFSKLESASLSMNLERQRLEPVVRQAVDNLRTLLEERRITLETVLANDLPDIMIDSHRITQVLTNLLSNAIKFSPSSGGRITVGAERWNGMVRVAVSDRGEGITPENLPKLFKKFTQIDSTSTRTRGGAGLGLAISKGIVEQHGGEMSVESVYGEGTTFYFTVRPATSPAAVPAGAARSNGAGR
jgi:signal transduction histidine kinase